VWCAGAAVVIRRDQNKKTETKGRVGVASRKVTHSRRGARGQAKDKTHNAGGGGCKGPSGGPGSSGTMLARPPIYRGLLARPARPRDPGGALSRPSTARATAAIHATRVGNMAAMAMASGVANT
jgi:hypothetical protein